MRRRCRRALALAVRSIVLSVVDMALNDRVNTEGSTLCSVSTHATFSTPMDRNALQLSIISAQHFCTRRATSRDGFSSAAAIQLSSNY